MKCSLRLSCCCRTSFKVEGRSDASPPPLTQHRGGEGGREGEMLEQCEEKHKGEEGVDRGGGGFIYMIAATPPSPER